MKCLHNLLKGLSLTGALFAFQACYGMPEPSLYDERGEASMSFALVSRATGEPLEGIRILGGTHYGGNKDELGVTGPDGKCQVIIPYQRNVIGPFITFEDPDGKFAVKDTSLADLREREIVVKLYPAL